MAGQKGLHIVVSGVVQGVGFRYFVLRVANRMGLKGFVKNRYDGGVETYAEGDETALIDFLDEVKIGPRSAHVRKIDFHWVDYNGKYTEFRIES
jgi:acylphosphatase